VQISLVGHAVFLHHALGSDVFDVSECDDALELQLLEAVSQASARAFGGDAPAPVGSVEQIGHFDRVELINVSQPTPANQPGVGPVYHGPPTEPTLLPVMKDALQSPLGPLARQRLAARHIAHHLRVAENLGERIEVFGNEPSQNKTSRFDSGN